MKLRLIILILSLFAIGTITAGGYFHYSALRSSLENRHHEVANTRITILEEHLSHDLKDHQVIVKSLAENKDIIEAALQTGSQADLSKVNNLLDTFSNAVDSSVVYLMNAEGVAFASSNRHESDSFVGKNYSFRPYFQTAISGSPGIYLALGKTSKKRGVYLSHPIYAGAHDKPAGAAIIKYPIKSIESVIVNESFEGDIYLVDPNGIIFVSSDPGSLYKTLRPLAPEKVARIKESGQFGAEPLEWSGIQVMDHYAIDRALNNYTIHQKKVSVIPEWSIMLLHDHKILDETISASIVVIVRRLVLLLSLLTAIAVFILYKTASDDLNRRRRAEKLLKESETRFRTLAATAPVGIFLADTDGNFTYVNTKWSEMSGFSKDKALGQGWAESLHPDDRSNVLSSFAKVLQSGEDLSLTYRFVLPQDVITWVAGIITLIRNESGEITGYIGTISDITGMVLGEVEREKIITELQQALSEIKTLRGIIPICSHCHKIKDDKGLWNKMETYVRQHTEAEFSHGICSECMKKHYPEFADDDE